MISSGCLTFLHRHIARLCPFTVFVHSMIHQKKGIGILLCKIPSQAPLSGMGRYHVELYNERPLSGPGAVKLASLPEDLQPFYLSCWSSLSKPFAGTIWFQQSGPLLSRMGWQRKTLWQKKTGWWMWMVGWLVDFLGVEALW